MTLCVRTDSERFIASIDRALERCKQANCGISCVGLIDIHTEFRHLRFAPVCVFICVSLPLGLGNAFLQK